MEEHHDPELEALLRRCDALTADLSPRQQSQAPQSEQMAQKAAYLTDTPQPEEPEEPQAPSTEQGQRQHSTTAGQKAGNRKRRGCRGCLIRLLIVLLILIGLVAGALVWARHRQNGGSVQLWVPTSPAETSQAAIPETYTRKEGVSTILLAGTDDDGLRTDTILLLYIDSASGNLDLLSLPRDTLVWGGYSVPKINSAYGWVGGGEAGMEELLDRVQELLGYRPDGYCAIGLDTLVKAVDLMGGIEFEVPMDMVYSDPWQGLEINLSAGLQTLNGEQAMGLLRFRSGYAMADLQRVEVQRDFLKAAASQWATPANLTKLPKILSLIQNQAITNLDQSNLLWLASAVMGGDLTGAETATLPGEGVNWSGGSYYVADPAAVLALVNQRYNIYDQDLTAELLNIRTS